MSMYFYPIDTIHAYSLQLYTVFNGGPHNGVYERYNNIEKNCCTKQQAYGQVGSFDKQAML